MKDQRKSARATIRILLFLVAMGLTIAPVGHLSRVESARDRTTLADETAAASCSLPGFAAPANLAVGTQPLSVGVGDFNGDGKLDLAVANFTSSNVSILLGNGKGGFSAATDFMAGTNCSAIAIGDFNGDGKLDLAVTNSGSDDVSILLGNGMGGFGAPTNFPVGPEPTAIVVGDFNGDGRPDLVVANDNSNTVSILLGNGTGGFTAAPDAIVGDSPVDLAVGDFNGDGKPDLAVANYLSDDVSILLGVGAGRFVKADDLFPGTGPISIRVGDFNGDGKSDIAVANDFDSTVSIFRGDGSGQFASPASYDVGVTPLAIAVGDFNGDGKVDLAVGNGDSDDVSILQGNGSGGFAAAVNFAVGTTPSSVGVGDFNGDGKLDFVSANADSNDVSVLLNSCSPSSALNPIDDAQFFVRQHYADFLDRYPDQGGLDYWTAQITQCGSAVACISSKRIDVSNAFFFELEFQQTGAYVYRLYRAAYGNTQPFPNPYPDPNYLGENQKLPSYEVFVDDRAQAVGGVSLAQQQLDLANAFVQRPEFLARYPAGLDGPGFVDALTGTIKSDIGVDLSSQGTALITLFNSSGRGGVLYRLADDNVQNPINNQPFIDAEYNRGVVLTQYFGYLRRDPDIPGFAFWLGQVNSAPLRNIPKQHAMVCSFITSAEYELRFGTVVTHSNAECPQ